MLTKDENILIQLKSVIERYESDIEICERLKQEQEKRLEGENSDFLQGIIEGHIRHYEGLIEAKKEALSDLNRILIVLY